MFIVRLGGMVDLFFFQKGKSRRNWLKSIIKKWKRETDQTEAFIGIYSKDNIPNSNIIPVGKLGIKFKIKGFLIEMIEKLFIRIF